MGWGPAPPGCIHPGPSFPESSQEWVSPRGFHGDQSAPGLGLLPTALSLAGGQTSAQGEQREPFQPRCPLSPPPIRAATQELALLISRMQANADQVERDILETQKKLQQVRPEARRQVCRRGRPVATAGGPWHAHSS